MALEAIGLSEFGLEPAAELLTRGFTGYFLPIAFNAPAFERMVRTDSLDLAASRVVLHDRVPVGVALLARRGPTSRLAGMALVPEARKRGLGRAVMENLIAEARGRGDRAMVLEVIEQNEPALHLYAGVGFHRVRRLVGYEGGGTWDPAGEEPVEEVRPAAAPAAVQGEELPDLPWQLSGATLAQLVPPLRVFRLEEAWVALANLESSPVSIRGLVAERDRGRQGQTVRLLRGLMTRYPGKQWRISALWPEELSGVLVQAGLVRTPLTQWQMMMGIS